jgi:hypothetical protein
VFVTVRLALDEQQVRDLAGLEGAQAVLRAQRLGGVPGRGEERLLRREAAVRHELELGSVLPQ